MDNSDMTALEIGIDIGGTKTHLRAYDKAGVPRDLILPTAEWRVRNWAQDAVALLAITGRFAENASVSALAVGAHGCDNADECIAFQTALERHAAFPVQVVNDAELLPAALGLSTWLPARAPSRLRGPARAPCWSPAAGAGSSATRAVLQA
jgi:glucosamine kinase